MKLLPTIALVCLLTACRLQPVDAPSPAVNTVVKGEKFRITLPEEHRSGYLWQLAGGNEEMLLKDLGAVWHGNEKGVDFNYQALATGQATLTFYKRKYTDTSEIRSFILKIVNN